MPGSERLTKEQMKEVIGMDMGGVTNTGFKQRLFIGYSEFFRPMSKKEERSERKKLKKGIMNSSSQD